MNSSGKKQLADETRRVCQSIKFIIKNVDVDHLSVLYALVSGLRAPIASYVLGTGTQQRSQRPWKPPV